MTLQAIERRSARLEREVRQRDNQSHGDAALSLLARMLEVAPAGAIRGYRLEPDFDVLLIEAERLIARAGIVLLRLPVDDNGIRVG